MEDLPRVLIVDDEVRGLELAQRILRRVATVTLAESGEDAVEKLEISEFDLVVSDQRMPGMSGVELLTQIAASRPETGRILLTGYADMEATIDAINRAGVHAYLHKPCPPEHFRLTVNAVLNRMETVRENALLARRHQRLTGLRPAVEEVLDSTRALLGAIDPTDDTLHEPVKRTSEASENLEGLVRELPPSEPTST